MTSDDSETFGKVFDRANPNWEEMILQWQAEAKEKNSQLPKFEETNCPKCQEPLARRRINFCPEGWGPSCLVMHSSKLCLKCNESLIDER